MGDRFKVLLLTLPVPSHDYCYSMENIPLAAGYLKGYARKRGISRLDIAIAPPEKVNYLGDEALVRWIESQSPDLVGFGLYVWNSERTLYLARRLKEGGVFVVAGGPEVTPDNDFIKSEGGFHAGVVGEGEETFALLLEALARGSDDWRQTPGLMLSEARGWRYTGARPLLKKLGDIPSPYLGGEVGPSALGTICLETVRGCSFRCAYCYYHKSSPGVRLFPIERIREEISWAAKAGVEEVYFMDPCFNLRAGLNELLDTVGGANMGRMRLMSELTAEDVSFEQAIELARAGMTQVEVGLQSTNPRALDLVRRRFDSPRFIRGMNLLRTAGVRTMVDVMVGLPGDTARDVAASVGYLIENELGDEIKLYPVSVLPGTELRGLAHSLGLKYQARPPYYVLSTQEMDRHDLASAFSEAEKMIGGDLFPFNLPLWQAPDGPGPFFNRVEVEVRGSARFDPGSAAHSVTFVVKEPPVAGALDALCRALSDLRRANPFGLISLLFNPESLPDEKGLARVFAAAMREGHPADLEYFATHTPIRSVQVFVMEERDEGLPVFWKPPAPRGAGRAADRVLWVGFPEDVSDGEVVETIGRLRDRYISDLPTIRMAFLEPDEIAPPKRPLVYGARLGLGG